MNGTNSTGDATGPARVGWVSPPNAGRSTWGIIWSCLAVFLLCSWKCTHLNIPSVEESEAGWHKLLCSRKCTHLNNPSVEESEAERHKLLCSWKCTHLNISSVEESETGRHKVWCIPIFPKKPLLRKWGRKLFFMALIAIAPEIVVALAARQYMQARETRESVNRPLDDRRRRKYTMAHAMFAQMGGYVVHAYDDSTTQDSEAAPNNQRRDAEAGAEGPDVNQAIDTRLEASTRSAAQNGNREPSKAQFLSLSQVAELEEYDISFNLKEEDIRDRSKADPFTKAFALVQAGWLVLQICARKSVGLQITELELMTMAFTVCALVTYILWWHKPFDAERSAVISLPMSRFFDMHIGLGYPSEPGIEFSLFRQTQHDVDLNMDQFLDLTFGLLEITEQDKNIPALISSLAFYVFGATFSAIHFAAWNWSFPLPIVQTLWQSFCCAALGSAILPLVLPFIDNLLPSEKWTGLTLVYPGLILLFSNIISRLALIGLTFYCFTSMPASTYQDLDWTLFLPHFS